MGMASRTPARTRRPLLVGGVPSTAPERSLCAMAPDSRPNVMPASPRRTRHLGPCRGCGRSAQGVVGLRAGVAQELLAAVAFRVLADPAGRLGQRRERTQEPTVGLVLPRHRTVPLPAVAAQQV